MILGSMPHKQVLEHKNIVLHHIPTTPEFTKSTHFELLCDNQLYYTASLTFSNIEVKVIRCFNMYLVEFPRLFQMVAKPFFQTLFLIYVLLNCDKPSHTLMQVSMVKYT